MSADLDLSVNSCAIAAPAESAATGAVKTGDQLGGLESSASNFVGLCGIAGPVESATASNGGGADRRDGVADLREEGIGGRKLFDSEKGAAGVQLVTSETLEIRDRKQDDRRRQKPEDAPPAPDPARKTESERNSGKEGDGDECKTPTSEESKIPPVVTCPAAPRKPKPAVLCKRKLFEIDFFEMVNRADVDTFFQSHLAIPKQRCRCV